MLIQDERTQNGNNIYTNLIEKGHTGIDVDLYTFLIRAGDNVVGWSYALIR